MSEVFLVNLADCPDPADPAGRSYRQVNAAKAHCIPLGSLVELENGVRLFVAAHHRDCDQTPLYALSPFADGADPWSTGYLEDSLTVVPEP